MVPQQVHAMHGAFVAPFYLSSSIDFNSPRERKDTAACAVTVIEVESPFLDTLLQSQVSNG